MNFVAGAFQQTNDAAFCVVQVLGFIDLAFDLQVRSARRNRPNNNTPQVLCNKQDSDSLAGYIDATWDVTDQFSLSGGYRETRDERSWAGRTQVGFDMLDDNTRNGVAVVAGLQRSAAGRQLQASTRAASSSTRTHRASKTCRRPGPSRAGVSWVRTSSPTTSFAYGTISHGYKAGGYNDQTGTSRPDGRRN